LLRDAIDKTKAYYCLECGICTGSCPVSRHDPLYSPRLMVERALLLGEEDVIHDREIWSCLTCGTCNQRCPSTVDYTAFMRQARAKARLAGEGGLCTHTEKIAAIMDLQLLPAYRRSAVWLGRGARTRARSDTYYFAGCLPFLDVVFREVGFEGNAIGRSAVKLLNALGIVPAVGEGEVCCGHDAYWTGEEDSVRELARRNLAAIKQSGAKRVVFSCPECYYMFKQVYPNLLKETGPEPVFLLSLLAERLPVLSPFKAKVTYQDPCRLARYDGVTEEPRTLLLAIPELELVEMKRSGRDAMCCGSSSWVSCSRVNKKIQVERLGEAVSTGAQALVTACPKCNIHLKCALRDRDVAGPIDVVDLVTLLARAITGKQK
jgi:heterodisulfide reductase subunit D